MSTLLQPKAKVNLCLGNSDVLNPLCWLVEAWMSNLNRTFERNCKDNDCENVLDNEDAHVERLVDRNQVVLDLLFVVCVDHEHVLYTKLQW